jgi:TnpA family transposase
MKRQWDIEDLVEHFTLLPDDLAHLANKTGTTRLGFALLLKCFQYEGRFLAGKHEAPKAVVDYVAHQLKLEPTLWGQYDWEGRTSREHRTQIRDILGFREATATDSEEIAAWLVQEVLASDQHPDHLKEQVVARFKARKIEPPTPDRVERLLRSALATFEQTFCTQTHQDLDASTCQRLDGLLSQEEAVIEEEAADLATSQATGVMTSITWQDLKTSAGAVSVETIARELAKLRLLTTVPLPPTLFAGVTAQVLKRYRERAAVETLYELRRHPDATRYTLLAAYCWQRRPELIDTLVELLMHLIHRIETRAEKQLVKTLADEVRRVQGKPRLLYELAQASLEHPDQTIRDGIFPVVSEEQLHAIVKEYHASSTYHQQVSLRMQASYRHHYHRVVPHLLAALEFRSNNEVHQPVLVALSLVKRYAHSSEKYYPLYEEVPLEGVVRPGWRDFVEEKTAEGLVRINRLSYELCVLQALRERLRCRELWVVGANKFRNPEEDLPADFGERREHYFTLLKQPLEAEAFVSQVQAQMKAALDLLDRTLPKNPWVHLVSRPNGGWIALSPLEPLAEPRYLPLLKSELERRWPMTSLLDILKEADLRIGFTRHFKSPALREVLEADTLRKRLLLCLYGVGTNAGLSRISAGDHGQSYQELVYTRRRFLHTEAVQRAIADVANAIFHARWPEIWGEGTTTCASDSKHFGAWDQNLMTEWHLRYGGKGVMIYWHVEKHATCIYSQLKSPSSSEVASMIQGVLRHATEMQIEKQIVDTHGQSEVAFGFCHLLGFQLMPRLKNIGGQKLYRPDVGMADTYPNLQAILTRPINWELIRQQYEQMIKYATALRLGTAETEAILRRFTRTGWQHPTYQAFAELGKAVKTIFLCQYLASEELRREIHAGLNVIENWNSANGFIFYGKSGEFATNRLEDQQLAALSLHLLQICLVYMNTLLLQRVLEEPHHREAMQQEDWRGLTPLVYSHINPYGWFRLNLEERLPIEATRSA